MRELIANKGSKTWLAVFALALALYAALLIVGNRTYRSVTVESQGVGSINVPTGDEITVTAWNIGYAGLGAESDFIADGGEHYLPPDRQAVEKNIAGITDTLEALQSEFFILQEVAGPSRLTRGGNPLRAINETLAQRHNHFSSDFTLRFTPPPFAPKHGLYASTAVPDITPETFDIPLEPGYILGAAKRRYHFQVLRAPFPGGEWTIINLHLSAFDDGANIRRQQLRAVLDFAEEEYAKGHFVVMGGDWNLELARPARPYTTIDEDLFWLHAFPLEELAEGWQIAVDETTPTVRTNERPYVPGENFTTVIDGFVVSPNVQVEAVTTRDTDFQYTDHQPVTGTFQALRQ